jgi:hypothetical protein
MSSTDLPVFGACNAIAFRIRRWANAKDLQEGINHDAGDRIRNDGRNRANFKYCRRLSSKLRGGCGTGPMSPTPPILGGIHVSGGDYCPQRAKPSNVGTIISQPGLVAAMQAFPGSALNPKIAADMTIFVDEGSVTSEQTGTVLAPFQQLGAALKAAEGKKGAALITVAPGTYADLATTVKPRFDIRIVLPAGDAIFYPNLH